VLDRAKLGAATADQDIEYANLTGRREGHGVQGDVALGSAADYRQLSPPS